MTQRFYKRKFDGDPRWYVFMGDKYLESLGRGLLICEVGYEEAADSTIEMYTDQLEKMLQRERANVIERSL